MANLLRTRIWDGGMEETRSWGEGLSKGSNTGLVWSVAVGGILDKQGPDVGAGEELFGLLASEGEKRS